MYLGLNCRKIVLIKAILSDHHIDEVGTVIALFAGKEIRPGQVHEVMGLHSAPGLTV